MAKKEKSEYLIQAVSHALDLLEQFHGETDELGVTELSKRLKLHKNNVFRLLATLESRGYIEQNRVTENYRLGLKTLELGQTFIKQMGLLRQSKPVIEDLVKTCNETTYVAVFKRFPHHLPGQRRNHHDRTGGSPGWLTVACLLYRCRQGSDCLHERGRDRPLPA